ncbi:SDR family NAD(P)-dependent oxidoreductase, partial [Alcaligenes pakistanensis]
MNTSAQEFADECIAVTGAARGIGAAVTHLLLERGASVIALDLDVEGLTQLSQSEYSDRVSCHLVDIS